MADTHINAFYADVETKKQEVVKAKGELEAAILRLKSHPDYVEDKPDAEPKKPVEQPQKAPEQPQNKKK
jgi:hypothetical protein